MMRVTLALMAVLALVATSVGVAARATCDHGGTASAASADRSAMLGMDHVAAQKMAGNLCCNHAGSHGGRADKSCAQACGGACGLAAALASPTNGVMFARQPTEIQPVRIVWHRSYEPARIKRPPKSIA